MTTYDPYLANQDAIEAVLTIVCRKKGLRDDRADEFCQWTRVKLIENDCAILKSFKGESLFKTFITTVIVNKYRDWLDHGHGKFRISVDAHELGPIAVQLEILVLRDRSPYEEAAQLLVSKGVASSVAQCDRIWAQLKRRGRREFVPDDYLENLPDSPSLDPVQLAERQRLTRRVYDAMMASMSALPPGDHLILRLKYWDHVSVADIAKTQQMEQKPLYRRFERLLKRLEADMIARGVSADDIRGLFNDLGIDPDEFLDDEGGK